jgi:hypothetical protein
VDLIANRVYDAVGTIGAVRDAVGAIDPDPMGRANR